MIFHSYVLAEGLSSHYWNDNSSFPQSRVGWWREGGRGLGGNFPFADPLLSTLLPPCLPSLSQHMDAGVPVMFSRCLSSASALTKTHLSSSSRSLSLSVRHAHTHSVSPAAHCPIKETLPWPGRLPGYNPIKQWRTLWTQPPRAPLQCTMVSASVFLICISIKT